MHSATDTHAHRERHHPILYEERSAHKEPKEKSPIQIRRNKLRTWFKYTISALYTRDTHRASNLSRARNGANEIHNSTFTALAKVIFMLCWQWLEWFGTLLQSNILRQLERICRDLFTTATSIRIFSCIHRNESSTMWSYNFDLNLD